MSGQAWGRTARYPLLAATVGLLVGACGSAATPQEFWRPWYERSNSTDDGGATHDGGPVSASDGGSSTDLGSGPNGCSLNVTVTTAASGGRYAPRNIGAIWISEENGRFVKTLSVWAEKRAKYLTQWNAATAAALQPGSRADAISGATQSAHGQRKASWNCRDSTGQARADGAYKVCFELTDRDGSGPFSCVSVSKGKVAWSMSPPDVASFTAQLLEFQP